MRPNFSCIARSMVTPLVNSGIRARIDPAGRLIAADPELLALQRANQADIGDVVVMPGLARLALLSHRLQQRIERPIIMAAGAYFVRATARLVPDKDGVESSFADWTESLASEPVMPPEMQMQLRNETIRWASDIRLRLVMVAGPEIASDNDRVWLGQSLSMLFRLQPNSAGRFPLLDGLADHAAFHGQPALARLAAVGQIAVQLSAEPMFDGPHFTGFVGVASPMAIAPAADNQATKNSELELDAPITGALGTIDPRRFALRVDGAMRRPIGRIIANAETIAGQLDGPIRADYARYAEDIALAGRHLMDLVDDLADLQILERSDFTVAKEPVDLAEVARRAAGLLSLKARERHMRIEAPDSDETAPVVAEFRRVLQILLNLIGNAIRYAPENSQIWLCVGEDSDAHWITVADQGAGIAVDDQERLFEKFERLGRSDSSGSGLGLYISRKLARAMGGDILLDSAPGQGARFTLRLPRAT